MVHDEIFGHGDDRQNMLAEKAFGDARPRDSVPVHSSLLHLPVC